MPQHIGIVACSAEGASLCHRTLCAEGALLLGPHAHPELAMHSHSLADYVACLERGDWAAVAELMLDSAHKVAAIGAEVLICPDNTIHQAMPLVMPRSPRPWLHIADVVVAEAAARGFRPHRPHRHAMAGGQHRLPGRLRAAERTAERDEVQPHHHGRAGQRRVQARVGGRLLASG